MVESQKADARFSIARVESAGRVTYSIAVSPEDVPELVKRHPSWTAQ